MTVKKALVTKLWGAFSCPWLQKKTSRVLGSEGSSWAGLNTVSPWASPGTTPTHPTTQDPMSVPQGHQPLPQWCCNRDSLQSCPWDAAWILWTEDEWNEDLDPLDWVTQLLPDAHWWPPGHRCCPADIGATHSSCHSLTISSLWLHFPPFPFFFFPQRELREYFFNQQLINHMQSKALNSCIYDNNTLVFSIFLNTKVTEGDLNNF